MRKPELKSVGVFIQQSNNKVFSSYVFSFQGELCYGAVSWGYVESQMWVAAVLQECGEHSAEL